MDEQSLIDYVTRQRWYGAKSRTVSHSEVLDTVTSGSAEPQLSLALVEMRLRHRRARHLPALVSGSADGAPSDGLAEDAGLARELVSAMRAGMTLQGSEGVAEFTPAEDFAALGRELGAGRLVSSEQSNTSVVFDDALILKVFRRLEPGINPELEMLRFLTEHGFREHPGARRLVRLLGRAAHGNARAPAGVRRRCDRRLGARARGDRDRARALPRPAWDGSAR